MSRAGSADASSARLDRSQYEALVRLVGATVAREDEPAVAEAYADFRDAMDALRREFPGTHHHATARPATPGRHS